MTCISRRVLAPSTYSTIPDLNPVGTQLKTKKKHYILTAKTSIIKVLKILSKKLKYFT